YATSYEEELARLVSSFGVALASETGAARVLRVLAGPRSPMRELLQVVARDAALGLADDKTGYFEPMLAVEDRFGPVAAVFTAGKTGDAFVAYQDVLRDLAARLSGPAPAGTPELAPAGDAAAQFAARLSPAGALAFARSAGTPAA